MAIQVKGHEGTRFLKYDSIHMIKVPYLKEKKWTVTIIFDVVHNNNSGYNFYFKNEEDAQKKYDEIVENCAHHFGRIRRLEGKLDKFLSIIEVLPGGEEYEKADQQFNSFQEKEKKI
jgi:hypothetical protein